MSMDETRISVVIEVLIGNTSVLKCTDGMSGDAECVKSTVEKGKFRHIILLRGKKPMIIRWIIWSLCISCHPKVEKTPNKYEFNI